MSPPANNWRWKRTQNIVVCGNHNGHRSHNTELWT